MIKAVLSKMYDRAVRLNEQNILDLLDINPQAKFLDLGCDNGRWTMRLAQKVGTTQVFGMDIVDERLQSAKEKGIETMKSDLNLTLPYSNDSFDIVHANQVIEHLHDTDRFISEIYRVLKTGGYAVVSTENLASWCNIFALILGWQPFSVTNISGKRLGIGNPLSLHRDEPSDLASWLHIRVIALRALVELFEAHGFVVEQVKAAGYFPLPAFIGNLQTSHGHFITIRARK